jgi:CubicO group peptidase (beta-lactamase class C family)
MWLVQQGKLNLDEDVNRKLISWKVPENEFTKNEKVTIRRLLTHTAGLNGTSSGDYPLGAPVPTLFILMEYRFKPNPKQNSSAQANQLTPLIRTKMAR